MTTETEVKKEEKKEVKKGIWTDDERGSMKSQYGCEIIVENGSLKDVSTKNAPTDASIIKYLYEEKICTDLSRGARTNLFDMYYDKFKSGLKSIDYGQGTIKPNIWGYKSPQQKKKRK